MAVKLLLAFFAAPIAWAIDLQISYAMVPWACAHGRRAVLFAIPLVCLAAIGVGGWTCWSAWRRRGAGLEGGHRKNWMAFLALVGLMMHATFALLIVTTFAGRSLLSPCE